MSCDCNLIDTNVAIKTFNILVQFDFVIFVGTALLNDLSGTITKESKCGRDGKMLSRSLQLSGVL